MAIDGTEKMGDWGKMVPTHLPNAHITQTNASAYDGVGAHVTTNIPSTPFKVHDRFDANGNSLGSDFAKR